MRHFRFLYTFMVAIFFLSITGCTPKPITDPDIPDTTARKIIYDANWDSVLWMRLTAGYWTLAIFAAGTGVIAAIKNARNSPAPSTPTRTDKWLLGIAIAAAVATAATGIVSPAQQADRYRMADLHMQEAIMDYRASPKTSADLQSLLANWHQATRQFIGSKRSPPARRAGPE